MSSLQREVVPTVDAYLGAVSNAVPGLVTGLYLAGSSALDDYQPAVSDIDAVAVCSGQPDAGQCRALAQLHTAEPKVDVLYATAKNLATDPRGSRRSPHHEVNPQPLKPQDSAGLSASERRQRKGRTGCSGVMAA